MNYVFRRCVLSPIFLVFHLIFREGVYCSVLNSNNFIDIRESNYFIDKTLLIQNVIDVENPLFLAVPHGFGKSINLDMIRIFLSNTVDFKEAQEVFKDTEIAKYSDFVKTHLGAYPVIYCSFESLSRIDYSSVLASIQLALHKTFSQHSYLLQSPHLTKSDLDHLKKYIYEDKYRTLEPSDLSEGLHFLSKALKIHHNKPVVLLLDDYDSVILDSILTKPIGIKEVIGFSNLILSKALINNENIKISVVIGTSCVFTKLLPSLDGIKCIKFLESEKFKQFFGLTDNEVDYLVDRTVFLDKRLNLTDWYDGYTSTDLTSHMYNTRSVLTFFLSSGELKCYWKDIKYEHAFKVLLQDRVTKNLLQESAHNIMIVVRTLEVINEPQLEGLKHMILEKMWDEDFSDLYIHILMDRGYFTYDKPWERSGYNSSITVKFPNTDICKFVHKVIGLVDEDLRQKRLRNEI